MIVITSSVRFYSREDTEDAVKYISGTILDDRPIRVDFDWGFQEGRQWGRGRSGGQVSCIYFTLHQFSHAVSDWLTNVFNRFEMNTVPTMILISFFRVMIIALHFEFESHSVSCTIVLNF